MPRRQVSNHQLIAGDVHTARYTAMGNTQPNTASSASTASNKQSSHSTNGHTHPHHSKQPASPPYSLAYYSEALSKQDLSPAFFLSSSLLSPRPPSAPSSSPSFDLIAYADIARLLLSSNPTLSLWRYKLVPARISEYLFWRCLFSQLDAQHPDYKSYEQQAQQQQQEQPTQQHHTSGNNTAGSEYPPKSHSSTTTATTTPAASEREIESLKAQLLSLQQQITHLTTQLHHQQHHPPPTNITTTTTTPGTTTATTTVPVSPTSVHSGRWKPDKNTVEFFALDESLRSTLRAQKERRLEEVRREMRWIVDGERVEDGPGRWECCGKEDWQAEGCKQ